MVRLLLLNGIGYLFGSYCVYLNFDCVRLTYILMIIVILCLLLYISLSYSVAIL